jgi:hypothetical protein
MFSSIPYIALLTYSPILHHITSYPTPIPLYLIQSCPTQSNLIISYHVPLHIIQQASRSSYPTSLISSRACSSMPSLFFILLKNHTSNTHHYTHTNHHTHTHTLIITAVHVVSRATDLPFQIDDAGRSEAEATATGLPVVNQDTALNFRYTLAPSLPFLLLPLRIILVLQPIHCINSVRIPFSSLLLTLLI